MITFDTEDELEDYVERMNEAGIRPDLGIVDANGVQTLACRTAPGGDGYGFVYYAPNEDDGSFHCCGCRECDPATCEYRHRDWRPTFPVAALVAFDVGDTETTDGRTLDNQITRFGADITSTLRAPARELPAAVSPRSAKASLRGLVRRNEQAPAEVIAFRKPGIS
ncbi:hypothetical protein H7J87_11990 [Mycolicibacterium wolinskyi]|uniref:hypothetical protein n=1 Tax=Mycolicibacterium TaxID=1866885 RepID=UPI001A987569|nr:MULTISPECIES: hypothetical protein [Mycolicibacterium]MCV7286052.1 hypothetical protein [Mycolicibacterium wolinskyi]MCV7296248.1 hypothetical protein [Mycolicibacterium goodii]